MRYTRRDVLKATATAAVSAALPAMLPRRARAQSTVKIGTAVLGAYTLSASVLVALDKGFFKEQSVNAEFVPFRGGPDLVKAVISGDVLLGLTGSTDIIVFREAGSPIRMTATQADGNDFVLVGSTEGTRMAELKGIPREALAAFCDNPAARHAAGLAGFEASQRYGWDEVNQELVDAYIRVIRQHDGGQQRPSPVP